MGKRKLKAGTRIASAVMAAVLAVGLMPLPAFAGEGGSHDGLTLVASSMTAQDGDEPAAAAVVEQGKCSENVSWAIYDDGSLHITGEGGMIGWRAWTDKPSNDNYATVKSIVVEQGVTALAPLAFHNDAGDMFVFPNVETIALPEGLTTIGHFAFGKASKLETVLLPSTTTMLGNGVFNSCSALTDIYIAAPIAPQLGSIDPTGSSYPMLTWSGSSWSKSSMNSWNGETERFYYGDMQPGNYFCWSQYDAGYNSEGYCPAGTLNSSLRVHIPEGSAGYKEAAEGGTYTWGHVKQNYTFVESANVTAEFEALPALKAAKAEAKDELAAYKVAKAIDAPDDLVAVLNDALTAGLAAIDAAVDVDGVESALEQAKSVMDMASGIAEAKAELAAYEALKSPSYPCAQRDAVAAAAATGAANIEAATDAEGITAALAAAKAAIDEALTVTAGDASHGDVVKSGNWDTNGKCTAVLYADGTLVISKSETGDGNVVDNDGTWRSLLRSTVEGKHLTIVLEEGITGVVDDNDAVFNRTKMGKPASVSIIFPLGFTMIGKTAGGQGCINGLAFDELWFADNAPTATYTVDDGLGGEQVVYGISGYNDGPLGTIYVPVGATGFDVAPWTNGTVREYTSEAQVAAAREAAIAELEAIDTTVYRDAEKAQADAAIGAAKAELALAFNENAIAAAKKTATDAIAALKTDAQYTLDEAIAAAEAIDTSALTDEQKAELADAINAAKAAATAEGATPESIAAAVGTIQLKAAKAEAAVANAAQAAAEKAQKEAEQAQKEAEEARASAEGDKAKVEQALKDAEKAKKEAEEKAAVAEAKAEKAQKAAEAAPKTSPMNVAAKKGLKAKAKKATKIKKAVSWEGAKGKVSVYKISGDAKISVTSKGDLKVKKGLKAGKTYKVKVLVCDAGGTFEGVQYAPAFKAVTLKVKIDKK